jgi:hypothetical protein
MHEKEKKKKNHNRLFQEKKTPPKLWLKEQSGADKQTIHHQHSFHTFVPIAAFRVPACVSQVKQECRSGSSQTSSMAHKKRNRGNLLGEKTNISDAKKRTESTFQDGRE